MNTDHLDQDFREFGKYHENRRKFPPEELAKYAGRYVAFSLDGTRIVASGATEEEMEKNVTAAGFSPHRVVGSYIDQLDPGPGYVPASSTASASELVMSVDRSSWPNPPWLLDHDRNRVKFPLEELVKYAGKCVAFNFEGTQILASGDTEEQLEEALAAAGIHPSQVVHSYVDPLS